VGAAPATPLNRYAQKIFSDEEADDRLLPLQPRLKIYDKFETNSNFPKFTFQQNIFILQF